MSNISKHDCELERKHRDRKQPWVHLSVSGNTVCVDDFLKWFCELVHFEMGGRGCLLVPVKHLQVAEGKFWFSSLQFVQLCFHLLILVHRTPEIPIVYGGLDFQKIHILV